MLEQLIKNWWMLALRGLLAIVFGVIAFLQPDVTVVALVWLWGAYALTDGIFTVVASVKAAEQGKSWGMLMFDGICGIAAGVIAFTWTGITAVTLFYLVAAWAVVSGIFEIAAAISLRKVIEGEWMLGLSGVLSILLGVVLMANPGAGLVATVWMIGGYAILFGIVTIALSFKLKALGQPSNQSHAAMS